MRWFFHASITVLFLVSGLMLQLAGDAPSARAADCRFVLGFKAVYDLIPDTVGKCKVNEHYNPENGDALQETTKGLMVWRKADNFTAFTDGYRSWVNGPFGLQERLNTERFPWEPADPQAIALNLADMPAGFSTIPQLTRYTPNEYAIQESQDPEKTKARIDTWERNNGYIATFDQFNATGFRGTVMVISDVDIFKTDDGAHAAFVDWEEEAAEQFALSPVSAPTIGEESKAFRAIQSFGEGDNKVAMTVYVVVFRKGSVVSGIFTVAFTPAANFDDAINYARIVEARMR